MTTLEAVGGAIIAGLVGLFFWLFKRGHTRIDDIEARLLGSVSEHEVRQIIDDKLAPLRSQHVDFTRRLDRIESKIDKLLEK